MNFKYTLVYLFTIVLALAILPLTATSITILSKCNGQETNSCWDLNQSQCATGLEYYQHEYLGFSESTYGSQCKLMNGVTCVPDVWLNPASACDTNLTNTGWFDEWFVDHFGNDFFGFIEGSIRERECDINPLTGNYDSCSLIGVLSLIFITIFDIVFNTLTFGIQLILFAFDIFKYFFTDVLPNIDIMLILGECIIFAYVMVQYRNSGIASVFGAIISYNFIMFSFLASILSGMFKILFNIFLQPILTSLGWAVNKL